MRCSISVDDAFLAVLALSLFVQCCIFLVLFTSLRLLAIALLTSQVCSKKCTFFYALMILVPSNKKMTVFYMIS